MKKSTVFLVVFWLAALVVPVCPQSKAELQAAKLEWLKKHPLQVITMQYLGNLGPDGPGEVRPEMTRVTVRSNLTDRVITGILWKVEIMKSGSRVPVEVLYPYTFADEMNPANRMWFPPGDTLEIGFYLARKVSVPSSRDISITVQDYVYSKVDPARTKPQIIQTYSAEAWPFKSKTEPIEKGKPD
ncbi:MAG TPA: hypothetical protein VJX67_20070 [Blastocatellia bacterium]|nr:hypothetical protein [Blastocatellia bacterium]